MGFSGKVREVEYKMANRLGGTNDSRLTDLLISASYMQAPCHCVTCHGEYLYLYCLVVYCKCHMESKQLALSLLQAPSVICNNFIILMGYAGKANAIFVPFS